MHPALPSQKPLCLHELVGSLRHSLSGSLNAAMLSQVPSMPEPFLAAVQALQVSVQAVSQQTPSTQLPVEHCEPEVHAPPFARSGWHDPSDVLHQLVATQSVSEEQEVTQSSVPHT